MKWLLGVLAVLGAFLKLTLGQLKAERQITAQLEEEIHTLNVVDEVTARIRQDAEADERDIEKRYEIQRKDAESLDDDYLSDDLIKLLSKSRSGKKGNNTSN